MLLDRLMMAFCVILTISCNVSAGECSQGFEERIAIAKSLVLYAEPLISTTAVNKPNLKEACTLLRFQISQEGSAENIEEVKSIPPFLLLRAAARTLDLYKFDASSSENSDHYYLEFVYIPEWLR